MLETNVILQVILVFSSLILLTLTFISPQVFRVINLRYLLLTAAGITVISFFFLESILSHYLLKFYHSAGWSGYFLYLSLFFIVIAPFISTILRTITKFQFKKIAPLTVTPQKITAEKIILKEVTTEQVTAVQVIVEETTNTITDNILPKHPEELQKPEETSKPEEAKKNEIESSEMKKQTQGRKKTTGRKSTKTRKNTHPKKNIEPKKNTGGENAKD
ncbi:MAG: hypothetical protein ABI543_10115 [Ignavibacteria bacterium]